MALTFDAVARIAAGRPTTKTLLNARDGIA
jgi:hypothetical protein